ncbi:unnamed protein product [Durusdinium trenchii]|uniref:Hexosyltransferase n=1 Tax=Durusdinium trenchii TaxID=1381693 RepID=A0ABP0RCY9_9DINO
MRWLALAALENALALRGGPCSEWFDNAWLKSEGFSADVCCWGRHPSCWQGEHSYDTCCRDFDVSDFEKHLAALGHAPHLLAQTLPAEEHFAIQPSQTSSATAHEFFRRAAPAARAVWTAAAAAEDAASLHGLALLVMTAPGNFARRRAIRRTWLQMLTWPGTENITYAFAMCAPDALTNSRLLDFNRQLAEEQELFRDLLILPWLEDVYWGWPHAAKTFLALLAALERQPFAQHFAVLHDDVYVHIPRLALLLADHPSGQGLYLGNAYRGHDFVGHRPTDGEEYEEMHGHRKMS